MKTFSTQIRAWRHRRKTQIWVSPEVTQLSRPPSFVKWLPSLRLSSFASSTDMQVTGVFTTSSVTLEVDLWCQTKGSRSSFSFTARYRVLQCRRHPRKINFAISRTTCRCSKRWNTSKPICPIWGYVVTTRTTRFKPLFCPKSGLITSRSVCYAVQMVC